MNIEVKISNKKVNYNYAINYMEKRLEEVIKGKKSELLWILEHNSIYTGGIRSEKKDILNKNIKVIKTNRGGKITYHGPGQKIIYFVINLNNRKKDIRKLINTIEDSIIEFLKNLEIKAIKDKKNIGIWVKGKKIAAIGLRVSRWIAFHGFSINISNNLNEYNKVKPCGLDNTKITSVFSEKEIIPKKFENKLIKIFVKNINKI